MLTINGINRGGPPAAFTKTIESEKENIGIESERELISFQLQGVDLPKIFQNNNWLVTLEKRCAGLEAGSKVITVDNGFMKIRISPNRALGVHNVTATVNGKEIKFG